ncbi:glycosyltransferase family 2 protein [Clostridium ljungdahlii]|uniref:glycosyltransferase family 2 protein n=1 Tax=Clostridium ljungdahlii TaxID=1538 RepID=UPI0014709931|nr:glycosyltransferase family 2 protein [Clostridium ljungdahlii]
MVNYNGYKDTIECVNSLIKLNYSNYKIVIVDNASSDDSVKILKEELNDCKIIESNKNLGFAYGNNLGIKYALDNKADYVLLLNNDTLVETSFLTNMINSFNVNKSIGLVGCKIMYYPQKNIIWYGGGYINWFKFIGIHYGAKQIDKGQYDQEKEIDFMTGCCMLIKREVFDKTGFLSEDYFMYLEDVDFCVKVKDAGYKIWYNPKAIIYHKVGFSSGGEESAFSIKWSTRNRLLFMKKYKNRVNKLSFALTNILFYVTRCIRYIQYKVRGQDDKANAIIKAFQKNKF